MQIIATENISFFNVKTSPANHFDALLLLPCVTLLCCIFLFMWLFLDSLHLIAAADSALFGCSLCTR